MNQESPTERLHALIHHMKNVCEKLRGAINQAIGLRGQASSLEGPAWEINNNPHSSETQRAQADKMTAQAKELRKEAHESRVRYFGLFAHLRELRQDLDLCLLEFGEKGKELREIIDGIGFSSWSAQRGWPLASDDEGGIIRGSATLDKILATALIMFPIPDDGQASQSNDQQSEPVASAKRSFAAGASLTPSQYRANLVAKVIGELNVLKPQLFAPSDYTRLKGEHPDYLTFGVTEANSDVRTLLMNIQAHRQHTRLATQIVAARTGKAVETVKIDWARFKPAEFRRSSKLRT